MVGFALRRSQGLAIANPLMRLYIAMIVGELHHHGPAGQDLFSVGR